LYSVPRPSVNPSRLFIRGRFRFYFVSLSLSTASPSRSLLGLGFLFVLSGCCILSAATVLSLSLPRSVLSVVEAPAAVHREPVGVEAYHNTTQPNTNQPNMEASPAKRRVLGALDPNACSSPKPRHDAKLLAAQSPVKTPRAVAPRQVSVSRTPERDADARKRRSPSLGTATRGESLGDGEPAAKRPCLEDTTRADAQQDRADEPHGGQVCLARARAMSVADGC
jgi:hypothetical protein